MTTEHAKIPSMQRVNVILCKQVFLHFNLAVEVIPNNLENEGMFLISTTGVYKCKSFFDISSSWQCKNEMHIYMT